MAAREESYKPLITELRITPNGRSETVNRVLSDCGSEASFERAATRFEEQYTYALGSSAASRVTHQLAQDAQDYVDTKFLDARAHYGATACQVVETETMRID
ncbi:hypothetical protein CSA56_17300 [candidate division KSB3 bacterium]|uniref:Uncharacterized protein n=1 Tax=candidate division KSB3 bacterium TaxID=2044937 RepID=A0A2G6KA10_9BACT|nr:MAG: hypothetical protein CSA56_17300 [candidate division KSB3 bacterium]